MDACMHACVTLYLNALLKGNSPSNQCPHADGDELYAKVRSPRSANWNLLGTYQHRTRKPAKYIGYWTKGSKGAPTHIKTSGINVKHLWHIYNICDMEYVAYADPTSCIKQPVIGSYANIDYYMSVLCSWQIYYFPDIPHKDLGDLWYLRKDMRVLENIRVQQKVVNILMSSVSHIVVRLVLGDILEVYSVHWRSRICVGGIMGFIGYKLSVYVCEASFIRTMNIFWI